MSFLSLSFLLFVGATFVAFHLSRPRFRSYVLLGASYTFYASHSPSHAAILLAATLAVHWAALAIERDQNEANKFRRVALTVAVLVVMLAGFKLASAFTAPVGASTTEGATASLALRVLVPLGLSYYLFKLIGYLLDVYWENLPAQRSVVSLSLYASFFPQIVSGPIQRAGPFFEQLEHVGDPDPAMMTAGLRRILFGLFKKLAIADRLAAAVDAVHTNPGAYSSLELLLGAYLFALQLYADFSGVTDIAIGVGQLFGFKGPENFDLPFYSRNLQDYWRRWHMSLTSFLADYLFTPLRMALRDRGKVGMALAILVNMVAVGVWHGAAWTYAVFGIFHGICLVVSVFTLKRRDAFFGKHPLLSRVRKFSAPLGTFHLVVFALIIFRAKSLGHAGEYIAHLVPGLHPDGVATTRLDFQLLHITPRTLLGVPLLGVAMELANWASRQPSWSLRFSAVPRIYRWAIYYGVILVTLAVSHLGEETFIYAQF